MSTAAARLAVMLVIGLGTACAETTAPPDSFQLPQPDVSLNPERLSVGSLIATPCAFGLYGGRLDHLRDRHERVLVDVFFGHSPDGRASAADIRLVRVLGGQVLHEFNIPAVRARILLSRVPDLVERGRWVTVREVPDPTRYDVPRLIAGFDRPLDDTDVEWFASLGGRVEYRWDFINALSGTLPDRSIPAVRDRSDVEYVEADSVVCLGQ